MCAIGQSAAGSGMRTVRPGLSSFTLSAMNDTPQSTMVRLSSVFARRAR